VIEQQPVGATRGSAKDVSSSSRIASHDAIIDDVREVNVSGGMISGPFGEGNDRLALHRLFDEQRQPFGGDSIDYSGESDGDQTNADCKTAKNRVGTELEIHRRFLHTSGLDPVSVAEPVILPIMQSGLKDVHAAGSNLSFNIAAPTKPDS